MKHIILGDVHLGKGLSLGKPGSNKELNSRVKDQLNLLDHVLSKADVDGYRHIMITGDIYQDPRPHPTIVNFFMVWLKKCEKAKVRVDIVAGNHDILRTGSYTVSALDLIPTLELPFGHVYKKVGSLKYDNVQFIFVPYRDKRMYGVQNTKVGLSHFLEEVHSSIKFSDDVPNIMVGHLSLEGCLEVGDEIADSLNEIFVSPESFPECSHIWMGHIHHPQVLQRKEPYAAHIGSMDRSDFSQTELDRDKIIVIYDDDSSSFITETLPTRQLRQIDIDVPPNKDSSDFVINTLAVIAKREPMVDAIVRLDVQLLGPDVPNLERSRVETYLYENLSVHHVCKISESRVMSVTCSETGKLFKSDTDVRTSIKLWSSSQEFKTDDEKAMFEQFADECRKELEAK